MITPSIGTFSPGYQPTENDFPFCFTYEVVTDQGDTYALSELVTFATSDVGTELTCDISPIIYHKLQSDYLADDIQEAADLRHSHANKTVLDDFSESNGILQYDGHPVPQFPINDVSPTTEGGSDYYLNWINPNVWYRFGSAESPVASINIYQLQGADNTVAEEFMIEFWTGSTAPSPVIFPSDVEWPDGSEPTWAANKLYQVSIVNNVGLWCESEEVNE